MTIRDLAQLVCGI